MLHDISPRVRRPMRVPSTHPAREAAARPARVWQTLSLIAQLYVGLVILLGGAAIVASVPGLAERDAPLLAVLTILSLVTSVAKVNLPVAQSGSTLTICYVLDFTTLLLLGAPAAR